MNNREMKRTVEQINEHLKNAERYCDDLTCYVQYVEHYHLDKHTITFRKPEEKHDFCSTKWNKVKDKLPLYKQCILVLFRGFIVEAVYRGEYEKDLHVFRIEITREDVECKRGEVVTHWMSLPEKPHA